VRCRPLTSRTSTPGKASRPVLAAEPVRLVREHDQIVRRKPGQVDARVTLIVVDQGVVHAEPT
jgi:hypothetical protein